METVNTKKNKNILAVHVIGSSVLRKETEEIDKNYEGLSDLIENMFETMYATDGIGLAAPQINKPIRLFVIDATPASDEDPNAKDFKKVFINAKIVEFFGKDIIYNEGCLSIPGIREDVNRKEKIRIQYLDENFEAHEDIYEGVISRVIQHEYDHLEGILFTDRLSPLKKKLIKGKLSNIAKGRVEAGYKVKFSQSK